MATNSLAGVDLAVIAEETLPHLSAVFAPLRGVVGDFSTDIASRGASVTTRVPTVPTAVDLSSGYTSSPVTLAAKTITLGTFYGFVYGFNDVERSKSMVNLNELFVMPAVEALGKKVIGDLWNLTTTIAFATSTSIASSAFDRSDLIDIGATLTQTKSAPKIGRTAWLNPAFYAGVVKDMLDAEFPGQTMEKAEGIAVRTGGFDVYESNQFDDNSQDLMGLCFHRSSLLIAARGVDFPAEGSASGVQVENVVVPGLELPIQFRKWYDPDAGELKYSVGLLYGVAVGNDFAVRITSLTD